MNRNIIKVAALALVLVMLAATLVSCGGLSGTYEASVIGTGASYTFKGNKVTIQAKAIGANIGEPVEGTYKISGDEITITIEGDSTYSGTFDFEKGEDTIKIGIVEYKKK